MRKDGVTIDDISVILQDDHHITITPAGVKKRLADWQVTIRRTAVARQDEVALKAAIAAAFHMVKLSDKKTCVYLKLQGFDIGIRTLRRVRKSLNLWKRLPAAAYDEIEQHIREVVRAELDKGVIEDFGRNHVYAYMRTRYNFIVNR